MSTEHVNLCFNVCFVCIITLSNTIIILSETHIAYCIYICRKCVTNSTIILCPKDDNSLQGRPDEVGNPGSPKAE